jgi:all-trans-retinol 13,14-reductase
MGRAKKHRLARFCTRPRDASRGPFDVIVIGSGMSGMSCAAALAQTGRRVLVLEQHYIPGGCTHVFSRKGYSWDVGVHAIGQMQEAPGKLLAWLTDGKLRMSSLGDPYDRFDFPDSFRFSFSSSREKFAGDLKEKFPDEALAIDRYLALVNKAANASMGLFMGRSFPEWLDKAYMKLIGTLFGDWWGRTTQDVLSELTSNEKLKAVLTAQWGYYGATPDQSSFALHALTIKHFWHGAYYPVGGSTSFAECLLDVVQEAGGQSVVRASVAEIIVRDGRAVGVRLEKGEEFSAPIIVSATGAKSTFDQLIPREYRDTSWSEGIKPLGGSPAYVCLNLGFKGDIKAAGASSANFWFKETWDLNHLLWELHDPRALAPILYVSFPSLKDPLHDPGVEQRHTGECIAFVPWDAFEPWQHTRRGRREKSYQEYKKQIQERLLAQLRTHIPKVLELLDYQEMSTPLSTQFFIRSHQGAIYGLEATHQRFINTSLRTRTPIKGLYLSGADITMLGVGGALASGLLTAATIDKTIYPRLLGLPIGRRRLHGRAQSSPRALSRDLQIFDTAGGDSETRQMLR